MMITSEELLEKVNAAWLHEHDPNAPAAVLVPGRVVCIPEWTNEDGNTWEASHMFVAGEYLFVNNPNAQGRAGQGWQKFDDLAAAIDFMMEG